MLPASIFVREALKGNTEVGLLLDYIMLLDFVLVLVLIMRGILGNEFD
ncbi:MAG: hypothetical protein AB8U44_04375 [Aaplasma endosymbiont of Hyalomma asiaticum]